jgi:hypothetical protein
MINLKMKHYDLSVSVHCENSSEGYEVSTAGLLLALEEFLSKLEFYDNVNVSIVRDQEHVDNFTLSLDDSDIDLSDFHTPLTSEHLDEYHV